MTPPSRTSMLGVSSIDGQRPVIDRGANQSLMSGRCREDVKYE